MTAVLSNQARRVEFFRVVDCSDWITPIDPADKQRMTAHWMT
jgi:hypothetical protein